MKTLDTQDLSTVAGGLSKSDQVTQTLTSVQTSIKELASQRTSSNNDYLMPMMMMMAFSRPQQTVVAAGAPVAQAAGPIINVSTRVRRW